jgi:DNA-binding response OmpR family regulator
MMDKHVLVVDDDPVMRDVVADYLSEQHFSVSAVANGEEMTRVLAEKPVDLMILDLKLTNEDGFDLMRGLSADASVPIIVVTGHRRDEIDRVVGLELGADDYVLKPFSLRELLARVRAVLRRWEAGARRVEQVDKRTRYRFAGWELSLKTRRLTSPHGQSTPLTAGEFNLLTAFLRAPQHVLSREQLLAASRVHDEEVFDRSIDVQILRLRRKLEPDPSNPTLLKTERGAGYVFSAPVEVL